MQGVDAGGPTSQFISDVCMQLSSLSVMLPLDKDVSGSIGIVLDSSRKEVRKKDFLVPEIGCEVQYRGHTGTLMSYDTATCKATILKDDGTQSENVSRFKFLVTKVPIKLFEENPCGIFPRRDDYFEGCFDKFKTYGPQMDLEEIEKKARLYFRALGRFFLHVMADGNNPIPSTVFPEMLRNSEFTTFLILSLLSFHV